jgi:hypothetical protein
MGAQQGTRSFASVTSILSRRSNCLRPPVVAPGSSRKEIINLYFSNLSRSEIAQGIDRFYQDAPENAPLDAALALQYVTKKAGGATQSQLDDFVSAARKASAQ